MKKRKPQGYPALIIGAGRGGFALLEMFLEDRFLVEVIAIADSNPDAPGIKLAKSNNISTYENAIDAMHACTDFPECIVYNLSHDDSIAEQASIIFGNDKRVTSGLEVKLFWQMVTNLKQVKLALEKSQNHLQAVIHNAMDGIITINDSGSISGFNPAAEQIFGYDLHEVMGENLNLLMPEPFHSEHDAYLRNYLHTGEGKVLGVSRLEVLAVRKNGEQFPMELSASEMLFGGERYYIGIVRDITERKQAEEKIAHLAHYDFLTNLPNRALFLDNLGYSVSMAKRNHYRTAVLFLDLDGFKRVNDTMGHDKGDLLLQEVSNRLKKLIRASDTVARVGGDEFIFVLNKIGIDENAATMAKKIIASLSEPFELKDKQCIIGGSIGISIFPDAATDPETLIRLADNAMYLSKQSGKNTYRFYHEVFASK